MQRQGRGLSLGVFRVASALLGATATLLAIGFGPAITPAAATTVLRQDWESGLKSEIPAATDPLTKKADQWLTFSGGFPHVGGFGEEPAQGKPDTELVGADGTAGWPSSVKFFGDGGTETTDTPAQDRHNLWHVQSNPQNISINPFIKANLVSLPTGDSGALPTPTSGSGVAWFGSESSGTFCDTLTELEANPDNQPGANNGCETNPDPEEHPGGGVGFGETDEEGELVSPPFSLVGAASAVLHLNSWFEVEAVEANLFDIMEIDYTTKPGTASEPFEWHELGSLNPENDTAGAAYEDYTDEGQNTPASWQPILGDLAPAIGEPEVRVRFVFDTWDVLYNGFRGWLIDDINVTTPSDAGTPQITGVDTCSGTSVAPITVIHGSNFFVGSTVKLDGIEQPGQTPSSTRIEIPAIEAGTHTIQVIDPDGGATSNVFTVAQPSSCEPAPVVVPPPSPTITPNPGPPPTVVVPASKPPVKDKLVVLGDGEIEEEDEFPEDGEAEYSGVVEEGASLASFEGDPLGQFEARQLAVAATAKCKKGFVHKAGKCVSNKPVPYGHLRLLVSKPGHYKLRIKPSKTVLAALKKGRTLHVKLKLVFTPAGTADHIRSVRYVTVHLKKKHKK
jgi:hypothetical protein